MQEHEFIKLFHELCVAFRQEFNKETALVYFKYLSQFKKEDFQKVVEKYIFSGGKFFPSIAELVEEMQPPDVGQAWQRVVDVARGGCRGWRRLTDTDVATVSAIGGMHLIQMADEDKLKFAFNDFQRQYPIIFKRQIKYPSGLSKLKDLNTMPETYLFISKSEKLIAPTELPKELTEKVGKAVEDL